MHCDMTHWDAKNFAKKKMCMLGMCDSENQQSINYSSNANALFKPQTFKSVQQMKL